jgi:hypothetical protein
MSAEPNTPAASGTDSPPSSLKELRVTILVSVAILLVFGVSSAFVIYYKRSAKANEAQLHMRALEMAYKSAKSMRGNIEPIYPKDIIPLMAQGKNALIDPWGGQYQVRLIQTGDGPRPQFFTFTPGGEEIVWPPR